MCVCVSVSACVCVCVCVSACVCVLCLSTPRSSGFSWPHWLGWTSWTSWTSGKTGFIVITFLPFWAEPVLDMSTAHFSYIWDCEVDTLKAPPRTGVSERHLHGSWLPSFRRRVYVVLRLGMEMLVFSRLANGYSGADPYCGLNLIWWQSQHFWAGSVRAGLCISQHAQSNRVAPDTGLASRTSQFDYYVSSTFHSVYAVIA